jgi:hypothetical protein
LFCTVTVIPLVLEFATLELLALLDFEESLFFLAFALLALSRVFHAVFTILFLLISFLRRSLAFLALGFL